MVMSASRSVVKLTLGTPSTLYWEVAPPPLVRLNLVGAADSPDDSSVDCSTTGSNLAMKVSAE